jgi:hypothetical protein
MVYRCQVDNGEADWSLTRIGDLATSWACDPHLPAVLRDLQRDWEITKVVVRDCRKLHEHADIGEALDRVAKEAGA